MLLLKLHVWVLGQTFSNCGDSLTNHPLPSSLMNIVNMVNIYLLNIRLLDHKVTKLNLWAELVRPGINTKNTLKHQLHSWWWDLHVVYAVYVLSGRSVCCKPTALVWILTLDKNINATCLLLLIFFTSWNKRSETICGHKRLIALNFNTLIWLKFVLVNTFFAEIIHPS